MSAVAVVPTGSTKAYAQEIVIGIINIKGLMFKLSPSLAATGKITVAVAEVRKTSLINADINESRMTSALTDKKVSDAIWSPISLERPDLFNKVSKNALVKNSTNLYLKLP